MIEPIYIHGKGCISIQPTFENDYFFDTITHYAQNAVPALVPDYKTRIPALQLRRMNKSMRMAIFTARMALEEAGMNTVDAVITGSGQGCLMDSERFVEAVRAEEGQALNPTPFIQSTHNMAAAAIALALGCKGYNMTHVNNANSFEAATLDALMYLTEHPKRCILLGGVDELGGRSTQFWDKAGYLKREAAAIPTPFADSPGEMAAEGAAFFVASRRPESGVLGKITAVETVYQTADPTTFLQQFLNTHRLRADSIDAVMLGYNGDSRYDAYYNTIADLFTGTTIGFKQVLGEYDTVVAPALALALDILKHQRIPEVIRLNDIPSGTLQRILIYSQRRGKNHSAILVERS